jgi:hypothetical protein
MRKYPIYSGIFFIAILVIAGATGCSSGKNTPVTPGLDITAATEQSTRLTSAPPDNFVQLGTWTLRLEDAHDGKPASADLVPLRTSDTHYDVGFALLPPICMNCLTIPSLEVDGFDWHVEIQIANPTIATVYDLMAIFMGSNGPKIMNPTCYTDLFDVDGDSNTHHPTCIFETGTPNHEWGPGGVYSREIIFRKYADDYFSQMIFAITASYPGPQEEVAEVRNAVASGPLYNDGSNSIDITVEVVDWQDDIDYVVADLTAIDGSPYTPMVSDAPGIFKTTFSKSGIQNGTFECMIASKSLGSDFLTYNYATIEVVDPPALQSSFILTTGPVLLSGPGTP